MAEIETLGMLQEIESLVLDKLQVVSYKWLSRNFLVSSNAAKRLLQEFVEKHGSDLEVVYTISGWLKNSPPCYHIRLVSGPKLEEAKNEFDGNCSIHVYSVQGCIPKDPAALWNPEFVQAEELFNQPSINDNCLRDNRFCGILNSFVKRNADRIPATKAVPQPRSISISGPSKTSSAKNTVVSPPQQVRAQESSLNAGQQSSDVVKDVKAKGNGTEVHDQALKPPTDKEKASLLSTNKKKGQLDKTSSGNGGSLVNLWGCISTKSKPAATPADNNNLFQNSTASADAQISASEAIEEAISDDEGQDFNFKRSSSAEGSRKRRVVLDYSDDDEEDAVNLASPDLPKGQGGKNFLSNKCSFIEQTEDKPNVKKKKSSDRESNQLLHEDSSVANKSSSHKNSPSENMHSHTTGYDVKENIVANAAPTSPKRRKVLKTCIDERGREVTKVVWEGEEPEKKKADNNTMKKAENNAANNAVNSRAPAAKKSPATGNTASSNPGSKGGNKKGANKDPKQGNILSFFKRA